jgi:hypothetical protein
MGEFYVKLENMSMSEALNSNLTLQRFSVWRGSAQGIAAEIPEQTA